MKQATMTFKYDGESYAVTSNHLPNIPSAIIFLMQARREIEIMLQDKMKERP